MDVAKDDMNVENVRLTVFTAFQLQIAFLFSVLPWYLIFNLILLMPIADSSYLERSNLKLGCYIITSRDKWQCAEVVVHGKSCSTLIKIIMKISTFKNISIFNQSIDFIIQ